MRTVSAAVRLQQVDPDDGPAFAGWYGVLEQARQADRTDEPGWQEQELRAAARDGRPGCGAPEEVHTLVALDDEGTPVGAARLDLPQADNRHLAVVGFLAVVPHVRRRGVGSALLAAVDAQAAAAGRTDLLIEVFEPGDVSSSPGRAFVARHGFTCAQASPRRDLDLPVDPERLAALERACAPYAQGYRVRTWSDRCPDELVEDRAFLSRRMSTDVPLGDIPLEEEEWDVTRVRRAEQVLRDQGRSRLAAGAVDVVTGRLVAFTEMALPLSAPERGYQWDTLVLREHRGHRLGTLLKVVNLRRAAQQWPHTRVVSTYNAEDNAPMIAVNDALGCRVTGVLGEWRRTLTAASGG